MLIEVERCIRICIIYIYAYACTLIVPRKFVDNQSTRNTSRMYVNDFKFQNLIKLFLLIHSTDPKDGECFPNWIKTAIHSPPVVILY